jgi:hypothetical protein
MRFLVSPQFSKKLIALNPVDRERVSAFLRIVEASDKTQLLRNRSFAATLLGKDVYVAKSGNTGLYFTLGNDAEGDYVLLLDATTEQTISRSGSLFATKDPRTNSSLNPAVNSALNPRFNSRLNPRFNSSINPLFNSTLNPRFNSSINPRMNTAFGGPYMYSTDLQQEGYVVRANDDVDLLFDLSGNHIGELVRVNDGMKLQFDTVSEWNGYLIQANDDVALRYTPDGEWIGVVV